MATNPDTLPALPAPLTKGAPWPTFSVTKRERQDAIVGKLPTVGLQTTGTLPPNPPNYIYLRGHNSNPIIPPVNPVTPRPVPPAQVPLPTNPVYRTSGNTVVFPPAATAIPPGNLPAAQLLSSPNTNPLPTGLLRSSDPAASTGTATGGVVRSSSQQQSMVPPSTTATPSTPPPSSYQYFPPSGGQGQVFRSSNPVPVPAPVNTDKVSGVAKVALVLCIISLALAAVFAFKPVASALIPIIVIAVGVLSFFCAAAAAGNAKADSKTMSFAGFTVLLFFLAMVIEIVKLVFFR